MDIDIRNIRCICRAQRQFYSGHYWRHVDIPIDGSNYGRRIGCRDL